MGAVTPFPVRASMYELVRTGHGSLERLSRVGLSRDDLGLPVSDAARRTGLAVDDLRQKLEARER